MNATATPELVTVKCWKCAGSGTFAYGTCFGCDGTGTNTYTAAAWKRKQAAAKGRNSAQARRNFAAQAARTTELATKTHAEMVEEVRNMCMVGHDGLVEDFGGERVTVEELATRMMNR